MFTKIIKLTCISLCFFIIIIAQTKTITIAITRPSVTNIKAFEQLYEKDIITLRNINLLCIYNENEESDYSASYDYVKENNLSWISFEIIKERETVENLFKENIWTKQFKSIFEKTNGIIFNGGSDFPPLIYNEEQSLLTQVETPTRSYYEVSLLFHLLGSERNKNFIPFMQERQNYLILTICLGCQTLNIACGGTLIQDIPTEIYKFKTIQDVLNQPKDNIHSKTYISNLYPNEEDFTPTFHKIKFNGDFFKTVIKSETDYPYVISSHHQALENIPDDLEITATSMDGQIIEAVKHKKYPNVIGVQFHPEWLDLYKKGKAFNIDKDSIKNFNLRYFFEDNNHSMNFHKNIWKWFSNKLNND